MITMRYAISNDNQAVVVALAGNADPSAALATLTADASQLGSCKFMLSKV
jgi:hypothetical protein